LESRDKENSPFGPLKVIKPELTLTWIPAAIFMGNFPKRDIMV
jgi:hypothetical protein